MTATVETPAPSMIPANVDAERAVLGAMILSPAAIDDAQQVVAASDFYKPAHELVFSAIVDLNAQGKPTEMVAVASELMARNELGKVGGAAVLADLIGACVSPSTAKFYAGIVRDKAVLRRLASVGARIAQYAASPEATGDSALSAATEDLSRIAQDTVGNLNARVFGDVLDDIIDSLDQPITEDERGITWGWVDLDRMLRPARPGQMIVIGARPGMGKTTFARNVASHATMNLGKRVLFHSIEVDSQMMELGVISAVARVAVDKLADRRLGDVEWERIARARERMDGAQLIIDDTRDLSLSALRASIRRHKPDLVVIDQIQLMGADDRLQRQEQISRLSRSLKIMAGVEGIPIVVVSQVNRASEQGGVKPPTMANLKESGAIESDADVVLLLHRDDAYEKDSPRAGEVDVIIAKQRHGNVGTVTLVSQLHYSRFSNFQE